MRFFFRSKQFKIIVSVIAALLAVVIVVSIFSSVSSPISSFFGTVTSPIQKFFTGVSDKIDDFNERVTGNEDLQAEVERLKSENAELTEKLTGYEQTVEQNEFYEKFLGVKDKNPEMLFQAASISSRDNTDPYKGFSLDVGLIDGVVLHDPVITEQGLVGYISEVATTYSKVTTVLSPMLKAGGRDNRTYDEGVVSGRADYAADNKCCFYNLQRDCSVSIGDYIVTAGGSVFPAGLVVGRVADIKQQSKDTALYAVVKPDIDFNNIRQVMVITYFSGQGSTSPTELR